MRKREKVLVDKTPKRRSGDGDRDPSTLGHYETEMSRAAPNR